MRQSRAREAVGWLVVDIDQGGLVATGKTCEFQRKGYFPRQRGAEGDQRSAADLGGYDEALQRYLDSGQVHCSQRWEALLHAIEVMLPSDNRAWKGIGRLDAGDDTPANRAPLLERKGYFLLKAHDTRRARRLAQNVPLQDWMPVEELVHGTELVSLDGYRRWLYEFYRPEDPLESFLMYPNLPAHEFGIQHGFSFYNQRQPIEAFFAPARHGYHLQNLHSRKFNAL